ncbi:MAG: hypothetical protein ACJA0M_001740 [Chitinophagales bacterium]|jgi:hypothetical protein
MGPTFDKLHGNFNKQVFLRSANEVIEAQSLVLPILNNSPMLYC